MGLGNNALTDQNERDTQTIPGMAHFANTGPSGTYCRTCAFLEYINGKFPRFRCGKYTELMKKPGPMILPGSRSCKYYQAKPEPKRAKQHGGNYPRRA